MKIVVLSDTHGLHRLLTIPAGDVLVHAGDLTRHGNLDEVRDFNNFLSTLPHPHKIVIAGNHDFCFERDREECEAVLSECVYLQDQELTVGGVRFYGSPWQPWFHNWAFNLHRGVEIRAKWDMIPPGIEVLITHGPPYGIGDKTAQGEAVGCEDLLDVVKQINPRIHVFGHIHEGAGINSINKTVFINASVCDSGFSLVNRPIVYEYEV